MSIVPVPLEPPARRRLVAAAVPVAVFTVLLVAGETWAKWWPYAHKVVKVAGSHVYPGKSILAAAGAPGAAPSWSSAWHFTVVYGKSVWIALVAAIVIGAGVQSLLPRRLFAKVFGRDGLSGALRGGVAALPCLMCTCCGAPMTTSLRRAGASRSSSLAYWLGNPLLNPVVLVFLALVLPWQFTFTRVLVGAAVVVGGSLLASRIGAPDVPRSAPEAAAEKAPASFLRALARLAVVLVPEYFVVVLAVGAFRGWLFPLGHAAAGWGFAAVLIAAAAGTLLVIPTGAEIPVIVGLTSAGFAAGVTGAVLIALPAISLPSMVMVGRDLSWRVVGATAGIVMAAALAGGALLELIR